MGHPLAWARSLPIPNADLAAMLSYQASSLRPNDPARLPGPGDGFVCRGVVESGAVALVPANAAAHRWALGLALGLQLFWPAAVRRWHGGDRTACESALLRTPGLDLERMTQRIFRSIPAMLR